MPITIIDPQDFANLIDQASASLQQKCLKNGQPFDITPLQEHGAFIPATIDYLMTKNYHGMNKDVLIQDIAILYRSELNVNSQLSVEDLLSLWRILLKDY